MFNSKNNPALTDRMNWIFQDVQNGLSSALLRLILKNAVHPVYVLFILHTKFLA